MIPQGIVNNIPYPFHYHAYNQSILEYLKQSKELADRCRVMGLDPTLEIESKITFDLADRIESLLDIEGVAERLRKMFSQQSKEETALKIAEELALGRFVDFDTTQEALDTAVRLGLAVITDGVTVAPLQGIHEVVIKKNADNTDYASVSFAGPIRSAGGTEAAFTLVIADHVRRLLGLEKYRPDYLGDDEAGRFLEELRIYEREVSNFQFRVSDESVQYVINHIPVEIDGVETDQAEVAIHRGLKRIETDRVRGGALRVLNDGVIGRARKVLSLVNRLSIPGWEWLNEMEGQKQSTNGGKTGSTHFEDVISGRPVFSLPGKPGGFRLRYGRSFNTGLSTMGFHPSLSIILDDPYVVGTQVKVDLPGKAATVAFVDTIEGPIVKLLDESVVKVENTEQALSLKNKINKVLHLGDVLISYGDFLENGVILPQSPYVEEWWSQDLEVALKKTDQLTIKDPIVNIKKIEGFLENHWENIPTVSEAFSISSTFHIPLHPKYLYFWDLISTSEALSLRDSLSILSSLNIPENCEIRAPLRDQIKKTLEKIGAPHLIKNNDIYIQGDVAYSLIKSLGLQSDTKNLQWDNTIDLLSALSGISIRKKSSITVGVRVGRPEKAMLRKMKPLVHTLFPIGSNGGLTRDLLKAGKNVSVELIHRVCPNCKEYSTFIKCQKCGSNTNVSRICPSCNNETDSDLCSNCQKVPINYLKTDYPINNAINNAISQLHYKPKPPLKGVKGLSNSSKVPELLEKGILRNKYNLSLYKDGTIRFDATNAPLTHFKPKDIGATTESLRHLGYNKDIYNKPIENEDQIVELFIQDIILPKEAGTCLVGIANFIDDLLTHVYHQEPFYKIRKTVDLIGHLAIGLAPHTSVGVLGRIIGFTNAQVCFAHPYWQAAKRRDCDGDEDAILLLLDVLLNFSREYLPSRIGGLMDAPLLLQPLIIPAEVDEQAHNFDIDSKYSLNFYESTLKETLPDEILSEIDVVKKRLKDESHFFNLRFTHPTSTIIYSKSRSTYSVLESLKLKLEKQIEIAEKINGVDPNEVVASVLRTHLVPDIVGNLRAYTSQSFRCKKCQTSYRRYPLKGTCLSCDGKLQPTISQRSVEKYLELGTALCSKYQVGDYLRKRFELITQELRSIFPDIKKAKQTNLTDFVEE